MTRVTLKGRDNWRYRQPTRQPTGLTREQIDGPLTRDGALIAKAKPILAATFRWLVGIAAITTVSLTVWHAGRAVQEFYFQQGMAGHAQ